jgi:hypothetical protein
MSTVIDQTSKLLSTHYLSRKESTRLPTRSIRVRIEKPYTLNEVEQFMDYSCSCQRCPSFSLPCNLCRALLLDRHAFFHRMRFLSLLTINVCIMRLVASLTSVTFRNKDLTNYYFVLKFHVPLPHRGITFSCATPWIGWYSRSRE